MAFPRLVPDFFTVFATVARRAIAPTLVGLVLTLLVGRAVSLAAPPNEERYTFRTWDGQQIEGFRGRFDVPENRLAPHSRTIPIEYFRLPTTAAHPGPPIVYLAGGPGGSGIQAINYRFTLFMDLRKYGDVIALDQRGTGQLSRIPDYRSQEMLPVGRPYSDAEFIALHRQALRDALVFWKEQGVDVGGYNTVENARDLEALRVHLGADKLSLWGISYGSTLALAAIREMGPHLDRVILASAEGVDQTVKLPTQTEAYFDRLQAAVDAQPAARAAYGDIRSLMRRVHAKLEATPVPLSIKTPGGTTVDLLLQRRDLQMLAGILIADPDSAAALLRLYQALDRGERPSLAGIPSRLLPDHFLAVGQPIVVDGMSTLMDLASGIDPERRAAIAQQAPHTLLGDWLDFTQHYEGIAPELDLGASFRTPPTSDVPVLLLSGSLDGRTTLESQQAAVVGLHHLTRIVIENAGHNPPFTPEVLAAMGRFMSGQSVTHTRLHVDPPRFTP